MGREPRTVVKEFASRYDKAPLSMEVELFTWEKLDMTERIKEAFGIA